MKRLLDFVLALIAAAIFALPMLLIALAIKTSSSGPALYWSRRIGRDNRPFQMPKFRSMLTTAPTLATHLFEQSDDYLTPIGRFIRKSSLDELPQLWSVLKGDMSLVGPRPALFNQDDLIELRATKGVDRLRPGVTGWAQINGRDELSIEQKVYLDEEYAKNRSLWLDCKIIVRTISKVLMGSGVSH